MIIVMKSSLGTRKQGRLFREDILTKLQETEDKITFDFQNVQFTTNSFADEAFVVTAEIIGLEYFKSRTTFININKISVVTIRLALERKFIIDI